MRPVLQLSAAETGPQLTFARVEHGKFECRPASRKHPVLNKRQAKAAASNTVALPGDWHAPTLWSDALGLTASGLVTGERIERRLAAGRGARWSSEAHSNLRLFERVSDATILPFSTTAE